ncbi:MAG: Fe-S cluster assembly protein SufD [Lactobacillaceae bacterium]|jgi:Fe-S cluster assembly protein SufD|nr:Fe-S cluster assembly protein SufD [Lactobacillaceae bacterium]
MAGLFDRFAVVKGAAYFKLLASRAREIFDSRGIPTAKTEEWKYTKPRGLDVDNYEKSAVQFMYDFEEIPIDAYRLEFINGRLNQNFDMPEEIRVESIFMAPEELFGHLADINKNPFVALNTANIEEGVFIRITSTLKKPLLITYKTSVNNTNLFSNIRNLILVEEGVSSEIVEYFTYAGNEKSEYFNNIVNEICIKDNARLSHYKIQEEAFKANHIAYNAALVGYKSYYKSLCVQKGANLARNETEVRLADENAATDVDAAYIMNGWATIDTTTWIEHLYPRTYSNQLVKGVVGGQAKGVFQGRISIPRDMVGVEGNQLHKALLLSDMAEVDVKPELEIYADDVKCSHGAATGVLDERQLFYMRIRGISEEEAKQMLIDAYLDDVLSKIDNNALYSWVRDRIK